MMLSSNGSMHSDSKSTTLNSASSTKTTSSSASPSSTSTHLDLSHLNLTHHHLPSSYNEIMNHSYNKLIRLNMSYNQLDNEGAILLSKYLLTINTDLKVLDLSFNNISNDGIQALCQPLKSNTSLDTLFLSGNRISDDGFLHLKQLLEINTTLTTLHVSGNSGGPIGFKHLSDALCSNKTLRVLVVNGNNGSAAGAAHIAKSLFVSKALKHINLSNNKIGDEGLDAFSEALYHQKTLRSIELSFNNISHLAAERLSFALWNYTSLSTLLIDNNKLGDAGARLLSQCLSSMNLSHLNVGFNDIGPAGIISILKACLFPINSSSMTVLNISGSIINVEVARLLGDLLGQNCTLRELYLDRTNIGAVGERYIAAAIASNKRCGMIQLTGFDLGEVLTTLGSPVALATMSNTKALAFLADMWRTLAVSDGTQGQHTESGRTSSNSSTTVCDEDAVQSNQRSHVVVAAEVNSLSTDVKLLSMSHDLTLLESRAFSRAVLPIDYSIKPSSDMRNQSSHLTNGVSSSTAAGLKESENHLEKYVHALREITFLPFIAADLWSLHQYYFSPASRKPDQCSDGSTSESDGESPNDERPSRHRRVGSDRPKKKQGNKSTMARIAGYPRLKNLLEQCKSDDSETRLLIILRQLKFLEDNADDLNDFDLESALIESF